MHKQSSTADPAVAIAANIAMAKTTKVSEPRNPL
jgi:hypothetical protein